ncbi:unnamed protein product [Linum trigynum]|uniref:Pentatricopeptide repeat-containing protein n=1 Tax=Linum trigynum TaxID=586398 RepID=A0AAV2DZJ0_9ROSI
MNRKFSNAANRKLSFPAALDLLNAIDWRIFSNKPLLFASLLQTSTKALSFRSGLQIHAHVVKSGLETDRFVGNSLLALYFKLGSNFVETRRLFDGLHFKDVISWNSLPQSCNFQRVD